MGTTKEKLLKFLTIFVTIVGTVITVASLTTMNPRVATASLMIITMLGTAIGVVYLRTCENPAMEDLGKSLTHRSLAPEVRTIRNVAELKKIADLDQKFYGQHSVDYQGLLDWWRRYPNGVYALFYNRLLVGAVGIWPLTENAFDMLIAGRLKESDLRENDLCDQCNKHPYWYFGDIILEKKYRGKKLSSFLLQGSLNAWLKEETLADQVELCAIGATPKGQALLKRFGFHLAAKSRDGLPIYRRTALFTELREDIHTFIGSGQKENDVAE